MTFEFRCPKAVEWHTASDPVVVRPAPSSVVALALTVLCQVCNTKMYPAGRSAPAAA
jgi:hypothetical protein